MNPGLFIKPHWTRLTTALMVSCLLHAALVFMPYLGAKIPVSRPALQGGQKPGLARFLNATLVLESGPAASVAEDSAGGASAADSSAARRVNEEPSPALEPARGVGLLPIPAPAYYTADQLTKRPQPTFVPKLVLPPEMEPMFDSGKVILKLWINELGNVISVDVEESNLPEAVSGQAVEAFGKLRFVPGEINGRRVGTIMSIEVTYEDSTRQRLNRFTPRRR